MKLAVYKETSVRLPVGRIKRLFDLLTDEEADPGSSSGINLVFTSDRKIRVLNRTYRNIDRATDVLSFNVDDRSVVGGVFGEIYISADTARKQAASYHGSLGEEILRLFCHGLLHLFGYDHKTQREETMIKAREEYYLNKMQKTRQKR